MEVPRERVGKALEWLTELPGPVRDAAVTFVKVAGPKLVRVRRPRDLRKLARDPDLIKGLGKDLVPVIEAAIRSASTNPLPLSSRWSTHLSATVTGAAGPVAANSAELVALFGGPETLPLTGATAFGVEAASLIWETYVEFSLIVHKLRRAGVTDIDSLRLAIMRSLVPDATDLTKTVVVKGGERLAVRLLTRSMSHWVPVVGPVFGVVRANIDVHRAHRAADSVARTSGIAVTTNPPAGNDARASATTSSR